MMGSIVELWNKWEIQLMVLLSFTLQVFLLLTGSIRRRKINVLLRGTIWLAYVGADSVAVFALGLFSHYAEKLGECGSCGDTLPFLWIPFLLVHLGGQDSITAFAIEDNNLWLRHLLTLGLQGSLALYILCKSMQSIHTEVLAPAAFIFVSGVIKYGERIWALRSGSRDGLWESSPMSEQESSNDGRSSIDVYALQTVLLARGLLVGRTMHQLGDGIRQQIVNEFKAYDETEMKNILMVELRMLFDLLYTKAMVLQSRSGRIFRRVAQVTMVIAFVLFLSSEKNHAQNHNRVNVAISYTLFVGAIFMEAFSVATVIVSPWRMAHLREGTMHYSCSSFMSVQCNKMMDWLAPYSMGQFNHIYYFAIGSYNSPRSKVICMVINALGLADLWCLKHVEAQGILEDIVKWFLKDRDMLFKEPRPYDQRLNYTLCLPFEHLLYRLHIFTDFHISRHFDEPAGRRQHSADVIRLKEDCEKLSNYMYYLKDEHPSMLPVSNAVVGRGGHRTVYPGDQGQRQSKHKFAENHVRQFVNENEPASSSPFDPVDTGDEESLKRSMEDIKELWVRLLVYAAGKCGPDLHARQLGNGGELLTFVWLLMLHHGLGDAATEVKLLRSDDQSVPESGSLVSVSDGWRPRPEEPRYAFNFPRQYPRQASPWMFGSQQTPPRRFRRFKRAGGSSSRSSSLIEGLLME